jgi:four helix bundle protein
VGSFLAAMTKIYDLEERTFRFANEVREFVKTLPNTCGNVEDTKQIIKSSGSVGANYIEANEALGKKDFLMRLRISRKEAKECAYFLRLIKESNDQPIRNEAERLWNESVEIKKILSTIILNSS